MGASLSRFDTRHTSVYSESDLENGYAEEDLILGEVLEPLNYVDPKPDMDDMENNGRYATYLVEHDDGRLQVALWGGVLDRDGNPVMILHPHNLMAVSIDRVFYPIDDHLLFPPAGYSWKREEGKTRFSIKAIMRASVWADRM